MAYPTDPSSATDLLTSLPGKFKEARQSGQLFFFESTSKDICSQGRRFNLRLCPALQDKAKAKADAIARVKAESNDGSPDAKRQKTGSPSSAVNGHQAGDADEDEHVDKQNKAEPFKPPYVPELYVGCLEGLEGEQGMSILLNKYSLLPEHMLLTPPTQQPQSLPPTPHQLALAYLILVAASRHPTRPRKLLAFYNGGTGAGASQSWRHLQFVEVPSASSPVEEWTREVNFERQDMAVVHPKLPYLHIIHPLSFPGLALPLPREDEGRLVDALAPALMQCLDLGIDAVRRGNGKREGGWNLLMTLDHLHLIPRSSPSFKLPAPHQPLELNSLGYAGMLLIRSEDEESALISSTGEKGLMAVLEQCGVPRQWGEDAVKAQESIRGNAEWQ